MAKSGLVTRANHWDAVLQGIDVLTNTSVMVGVPSEKKEREDESGPNNAEIGYMMENGIPEQNVPARPHLVPGIKNAKAKIVDYMTQAGKLALAGKPDSVTRALMAAGQTGASSVKTVIREGVPPPLADSTLRRRKKNRKGARMELDARAAGEAPSTEFVKPLINTGQYIAAITFVLRRVYGSWKTKLKNARH